MPLGGDSDISWRMERMRIHILGLRGIPSSYSGYETFIGELAPRLAGRGHDVTVYCRRSLFPERPAEWRGAKLVYLPSLEHKSFSTLSHSFLAMKRAVSTAPDVILAVNAATGWFSWMPRRRGIPLVINVDGMEWLRPKWSGLGRLMFLNGARLACRFATSIVTDAEEMHRLYAEQFGVDSVYIAYGANMTYACNPDSVRQYGLIPGRYFLCAGRLIPDNNADLIIEAFRRVEGEWKLAVAGEADYKGNRKERRFHEHLKSLADSRVVFLGHVQEPTTFNELLCSSFAYVHGHEYGGINPSLLQALGAGCMVLALKTPFSIEALDSGAYGMLYEKKPDDLAGRMRKLCDQPVAAAGFRAKARHRIVERFSWNLIAEQYEELLLRLVKEDK